MKIGGVEVEIAHAGLRTPVEQRPLLVGHAEIHASSFAAMRGVPRAGLHPRRAIDTIRGSLYR